MKEEIYENLVEENVCSSKEKIEWWDYGEWVEEPDVITFNVDEYECKIIRVKSDEKINGVFYGGHLAAVVYLPLDHPKYGLHGIEKELLIINFVAHTSARFTIDNRFAIFMEFSCPYDIVPSVTKYMKQKNQEFHTDLPVFITYKNVEFVKEICIVAIAELTKFELETAEIGN